MFRTQRGSNTAEESTRGGPEMHHQHTHNIFACVPYRSKHLLPETGQNTEFEAWLPCRQRAKTIVQSTLMHLNAKRSARNGLQPRFSQPLFARLSMSLVYVTRRGCAPVTPSPRTPAQKKADIATRRAPRQHPSFTGAEGPLPFPSCPPQPTAATSRHRRASALLDGKKRERGSQSLKRVCAG